MAIIQEISKILQDALQPLKSDIADIAERIKGIEDRMGKVE